MAEEYPPGRGSAPAGPPRTRWRWTIVVAALACAALLAGGLGFGRAVLRRDDPRLVLPKAIRDSMDAVFVASNQHWNELGDLNTLERMLGTVRPTQREYLGCLQGTVRDGAVRVDGWTPASDMKRLQLAVTGNCDGVPRLVGTWHTHPFRADAQNLPLKERTLSPQDLRTFNATGYSASIVIWDVDSIDAAVRAPDASVHHPAAIRIE
ncbi:MAG TPA: hypothetical protein VIE46_09500 [Gemmatimonadales bacterium]